MLQPAVMPRPVLAAGMTVRLTGRQAAVLNAADAEPFWRRACPVLGISPEQFRSASREPFVVIRRRAIYHVQHHALGMSKSAIARIARRENATIIHALKQTALLIESDPEFATMVRRAESVL